MIQVHQLLCANVTVVLSILGGGQNRNISLMLTAIECIEHMGHVIFPPPTDIYTNNNNTKYWTGKHDPWEVYLPITYLHEHILSTESTNSESSQRNIFVCHKVLNHQELVNTLPRHDDKYSPHLQQYKRHIYQRKYGRDDVALLPRNKKIAIQTIKLEKSCGFEKEGSQIIMNAMMI